MHNLVIQKIKKITEVNNSDIDFSDDNTHLPQNDSIIFNPHGKDGISEYLN